MPEIEIYTTAWCGYCKRAKALLDELGVGYEEIRLDGDPRFRHKLFELTGNWTVPQVVMDGKPIGGFVELWQLTHQGKIAA
jgi:glutaredoxin 3